MVGRGGERGFEAALKGGILPLLVALQVTGCAPAIRTFAVLPHHACEGTLVTAVWDVDGNPTLTSAPPLSPVGGSGLTYAPGTDTVFTLRVTRWPHKPKVSETEVTVLASQDPHGGVTDDLPFRMACSDGLLSSTLERPIAEWDPHLMVGRLSTDGSRDLVLRHEGHDVTLTPQTASTDVFRGTHLGGQWALSTGLLPNERCGDPQNAPPDLITVTVEVTCPR